MIMSLGATKVNAKGYIQYDDIGRALYKHVEIEQDREITAIATTDNAVINDHDLWDLNSSNSILKMQHTLR